MVIFHRKYGQAATINFPLYASDGIDLQPSASFAAGDVKLMQDEAAEANATNLPTDEGQGYSLVLTAAELTAARVVVYLVDQTDPKAWLDEGFVIETYGHASAQHPNLATPVNLTVVASTVSSGAVSESHLTAYQHAKLGPFVFTITDDAGAAVDLSGKAIAFTVFSAEDPATRDFSLTTTGGDITVGGASNNEVTVEQDDTNTATANVHRFVLRNTTDDTVLAYGTLTIKPAPDVS